MFMASLLKLLLFWMNPSITAMIGLLIDLEYASDALELFSRIRYGGISHDILVIMNLISACAIIGDLKRGRKVHAQAVVCGFGSELTLMNSLIAMYSRCGDLNSSRTVFDQTSQKSLILWTGMILGYAQNRRPREALNLLVEVRLEENFFLHPTMSVSASTTSGGLAALELQQLHCFALRLVSPRIDRFRTVSYQHTQSVGLWNLLTLFLRRWVIFEM